MKHIAIRLAASVVTFIIGIALSAVINPFRGSAVSSGADEQEVLRIEREYIQANLNADTTLLRQILADDFSIRTRWGRMTNKFQRLALLESTDFVFEAINTNNVRVEVAGDMAVVTGDAFIRYREGDEQSVSSAYRFSREYEKRDGRWQIVSVRIRR